MKKMSKEPEVGDVWSTGNIDLGNYTYTQRYFIVDKFFNGAFYVMSEKNERCPVNSCFILEDNEFKHLFYLGKSKANIDDLFKTENEE